MISRVNYCPLIEGLCLKESMVMFVMTYKLMLHNLTLLVQRTIDVDFLAHGMYIISCRKPTQTYHINQISSRIIRNLVTLEVMRLGYNARSVVIWSS